MLTDTNVPHIRNNKHQTIVKQIHVTFSNLVRHAVINFKIVNSTAIQLKILNDTDKCLQNT